MKKGKWRISKWNWQKIAGFILVMAIALPLLVFAVVPIATDGATFDIENQALSGIVSCDDNDVPGERLPIESIAVNWGSVRRSAHIKISS